ncbi:MAG TPA: pyridoxamine 5'-phosphate oxidase family protein [Myxococcota bacterium]|jgi:nitroimidazol reductase NimA-like FMN-containing flavoprotein (pyridoxamine 5'-phosphate oxidase superfamily)|nr:pyridoxamine 5'-phosphate oxidase family protein [Myxococcota bacterium]
MSMTREERETFLAGLHVGVLSLAEPGRGPLTVPIWYGYEPGGEIRFVTERDSRKGRLLAEGSRVSLCAQTEQPPYRYVSVEGPVVAVATADVERDVRPLAHRYLGRDLGDQYVAATADDRADGGSILVRVRPERWLCVDYGKVFGG